MLSVISDTWKLNRCKDEFWNKKIINIINYFNLSKQKLFSKWFIYFYLHPQEETILVNSLLYVYTNDLIA